MSGARSKRRECWTPTREITQDLLEEATAPEIVAPSKPSVSYEAPAPQNSRAVPKAEPQSVQSKTIKEVQAPSNVETASPVVASAPNTASQETPTPSGTNYSFTTTTTP